MTPELSIPVSTRLAARPRIGLPTIYLAGLAVWLVTRWLVLLHQGAWPWMNAFVVAAARGIVVGDWNEAVRPQLPAVLGIPLVLLGASEQQTVAVLYIIASVIQFGSFLLLIRTLFPASVDSQALALLVFLTVPLNHSIHHYRDVPVVLASSAVFLLAAAWLTSSRSWLWVLAAMFLGVWSRTEVLTFVAAVLLCGLLISRAEARRRIVTFATAAVLVAASLLVIGRIEGVDPEQAARYQVHTFLDSTPESWLSPECRADPSENCRERDGLTYFGPLVPEAGLVPVVVAHPLTTLAKTARSALDNLWVLLGPNLSTFPGIVACIAVVPLVYAPARQALVQLPRAAWVVALAAVAQSVLPPLSWAPPHPQYHLQFVLPVVIVCVPVLEAVLHARRGTVVLALFYAANLAFSAVRYTRYPGY